MVVPGGPQSQYNLMFLNYYFKNNSLKKERMTVSVYCAYGLFTLRRIPNHVEVASWRCLLYLLNFEPLEMVSVPKFFITKNGSPLNKW